MTSTPGRGQHVHALPAAELRAAARAGAPGAAVAGCARAALAALSAPQRAAERLARRSAVATTARALAAGRPRAADRRGRRRLRAATARRGARARLQGVVVAARRRAVALAREFRPDAITLDIRLPDIDGWRVLRSAQGRPRDPPHPGAGHLGRRRARERSYALGAVACSPSRSRREATLDAAFGRAARACVERRSAICWCSTATRAAGRDPGELLGDSGRRGRRRATASEALARCRRSGSTASWSTARADGDRPRCRDAAQARSALGARRSVSLRARRALSRGERRADARCRTRRALKHVRSLERLLDETALSCTAASRLPEAKRKLLRRLHATDEALAGAHGADRRRRRPQHLRDDEPARDAAACR